MQKIKVFCDSMIWYDVFDGIEILNKNKFEYYGTGTNIADFISSDKMTGTLNNQQKLRNAILTMDKESTGIITMDPMTFASRYMFGTNIDENEIDRYKSLHKSLLDFANNQNAGIYGPGKDSIINQKENFKTSTLDLRAQIDSLSKKHNNTKDENKRSIEGIAARWLLGVFSELQGKLYSIESVQNWNQVIVFLKTYRNFLMSIKPPVKATEIPPTRSGWV